MSLVVHGGLCFGICKPPLKVMVVEKLHEREQVEDTDLHELHSSTEPSLFLSVQHLSISYIEDLIADNIRVLLF
uniref:Uncharacterized protein n=1 Tax=Solanum lycopersicum TaxID=4081 RepID=K4DDJ9_SOLLC